MRPLVLCLLLTAAATSAAAQSMTFRIPGVGSIRVDPQAIARAARTPAPRECTNVVASGQSVRMCRDAQGEWRQVDPPPAARAATIQARPPAPKPQVISTDGMSVIQLLERGQYETSRNHWPNGRTYFAKAASLGDVQGMAALAYTYGVDAPQDLRDPSQERYWCHQAYAGATRTKKAFELDTVNFFCPKAVIAEVAKTQAERARNTQSAARAQAEYDQNKAEAMERARAVLSSAIASGLSGTASSDDDDPERDRRIDRATCRQAGGTGC